MSLHHLARQVQSQGRGDDKMLIHMTPEEVQGLQGLAMKHGGSLTINPETGLPEAGFLKNILPTVIGGAAMMIPGMQPIGAAMIGGGLGLAMSGGNLKQGILGGLGAWGGASLVGGMMGAGAGAAAGLVPEGAAIAGAEAAGTLGNQFAYDAAGAMVPSNYAPSITGAAEGTRILGTPTAGASIQEGFKQAAANPGQFFKQNMFPIGAAAAPVLFGDSEQQNAIGAPPTQGQIRPYTYNQTRNPQFGIVPGAAYFDQSYTAGTPYAAANGGLVALAEGGDINTQAIVPMQQLAAPVNTYGAKRPVSQAVTEYNKTIADRARNEYIDQPAPLATLPGRGQFANAADLGKIINRYYLQDLGRAADTEGLDFWTGAVQNSGMSLADVSKNIKGSEEYKAKNSAAAAAALESNPAYQSYMSAPITAENFDAEAYLKTHPDMAALPYWAARPYEHYLEAHRLGDMRTATKKPFKMPSAPDQSGQSGYTYDAATQRFTGPSPSAPLDPNGFMGGIASDPNFQAYLQNQYNQYQQSQYGGGGKAGGLMPGALRYNMGGISDLGGYSDGGRLLKGPGDGVSDSIPARIGAKQPARLADGEFVVPARIVSELGNGSTDAGARRLYAMMDRVQKKRGKTVGKGKVAVNSKAETVLPA